MQLDGGQSDGLRLGCRLDSLLIRLLPRHSCPAAVLAAGVRGCMLCFTSRAGSNAQTAR